MNDIFIKIRKLLRPNYTDMFGQVTSQNVFKVSVALIFLDSKHNVHIRRRLSPDSESVFL